MNGASSTSTSSNGQTRKSSAKTSKGTGVRKTSQAAQYTPVQKVPKYHSVEPGFREAYKEYYDDSLANYIYGLYHPDVVYRDNLNIKYPAPVPVPTTSFCFKDTFTLAPNATGNFVLVWQPNFLATTSFATRQFAQATTEDPVYYNSTLYYNNVTELTGNGNMTIGWRSHGFDAPQQLVNKYRLTSACIKVKYTGKVLNQSGCMAACATYSETPSFSYVVQRGFPTDINLPVGVQKYLYGAGDFDTIRQGQWAEICSLVSDPDGITCVWLPTDPLSHVFIDDGTVADRKQVGSSEAAINNPWYWQLSAAANMAYYICGYGIESTTNCITVETYTNYEIIVYPQQMPYFRPTTLDAKLITHTTRLVDAMRGVASSYGAVTTTKAHEAPSTMSRIRSALSQAWRYAGDLAPVLLRLGKAII